jgi:hypothetical protein
MLVFIYYIFFINKNRLYIWVHVQENKGSK